MQTLTINPFYSFTVKPVSMKNMKKEEEKRRKIRKIKLYYDDFVIKRVKKQHRIIL